MHLLNCETKKTASEKAVFKEQYFLVKLRHFLFNFNAHPKHKIGSRLREIHREDLALLRTQWRAAGDAVRVFGLNHGCAGSGDGQTRLRFRTPAPSGMSRAAIISAGSNAAARRSGTGASTRVQSASTVSARKNASSASRPSAKIPCRAMNSAFASVFFSTRVTCRQSASEHGRP